MNKRIKKKKEKKRKDIEKRVKAYCEDLISVFGKCFDYYQTARKILSVESMNNENSAKEP